MVISLYYSNYPLGNTETPDWENLPIGFFQFNEELIESEVRNNPVLKGKFLINQYRPRVGEHLLSVFSLSGKNYLCNSTISYSHDIEVDSENRNNFNADLIFHDIIKEWEIEI